MSTITDINNWDSGLTARTSINDNFSNLNTDKIEADSVDTLTNKTLTAPVINSPTNIVKWDVGLWNADNTSDVNKPVSTAQQTALDWKKDDTDVESIALGWTGQTTQQAAIDALTDVSSATDEYVLTKDTSTGNAVFKTNAWTWPLYWNWVVFVPAALADRTWTTVNNIGKIVVLDFDDWVDAEEWTFTARVPEWKTSISSIKIIYMDATASSLDLFLQFRTGHLLPWTANQNDNTDTFSTYASSGITDSLATVDVPAAAYNALTSISGGNYIWIDVIRNWNQASDTYWATFYVVWVEFTFA